MHFKDNYQSFQQYLWDHPELGYSSYDIMDNPDLLTTNADIGMLSALWYFKTRVLDKVTITDSTSGVKVSHLVNGGDNGLPERLAGLKSANVHINCGND